VGRIRGKEKLRHEMDADQSPKKFILYSA